MPENRDVHRSSRAPLAWRCAICLSSIPVQSVAGAADVVSAEVSCGDDSICTFRVTVRHADAGWTHYADRWEVLSPDGDVLGTRVLRHPHVNEQPFTRSLPGVAIPPELERVRIRARDSAHGYGGKELVLEIPHRARSGS